MKKYIYTGLLLLALCSVNAQNKATKKADKHFNNLEYVDAISSYLKVVEKGKADVYVYGRLADSYYNVFNTEKAAEYYAKVVDKDQNAEEYFRYAQMLKANGNYPEANAAMDKFAALAPNDDRAIAHKKNPNTVSELLNREAKFTVKSLEGFNTKYAEFGAIMHEGQVYYASARNESGKKYRWNQEPYLDIYVSDYDAPSNALTNESILNKKINTKYNEGTVSFSKDGKTMYFSGESLNRKAGLFGKKFKKDATGKSTINIYSATLVDGEWDNVTTLPFNNVNSNANGPAVSADGKRLYFSSDMEGTVGGADIWYVTINEDGTYGDPVNLGKEINTKGAEMFPYISSKNVMYFSSNGHPGLGMLDVFAATMEGDSFGAVRNAGAPINSNRDDFSYTIDEDSKKGFFASNRKGGTGSDDIYTFDQIIPICDVVLTVQVIDAETKKPLAMTSVAIFDVKNNKVGTKITDNNGNVTFNYECNQAFRLDGNKENYTANSIDVAKTDENTVNKTLELTAIPKEIVADVILLNPIYFELDKHNITAQGAAELDKLVAIMKAHPTMIIKVESFTDVRASDVYNLKLSERRAKATAQYVISRGVDASRISAYGRGETELVYPNAKTEEEHQANRRSQFTIVKK